MKPCVADDFNVSVFLSLVEVMKQSHRIAYPREIGV